ncbi:hypothetical protein [Flavobacterium aquiphilum]|uniref:hypothetical protein n=1 Tax=Flavobacterium aquiphilum TaxID=3003261 RepID=UPI002480A8E0|nr:hypothetical protein [Flavobacterium aquiphilum]
MDKIIKIFILALVCLSCTNKERFERDNNKIIFRYSRFITVDFDERIIKVNYAGLKYSSVINLSNREDSLIINSFNKNKIYEVDGEFAYPDCPWLMPSFEDRIEIYIDKKLKSRILINSKPNCVSKTPSVSSQEYRIVQFKDDIKKILENNGDFKISLDTLKKFQKQKKVLFL